MLIAPQCVAIVYPILHIIAAVRGGGGRHIWEVTYVQYASFYNLGGAAVTSYYVSVGLIKMSITLFLRRLVHQAFRPWKIFCDVLLGTLVLYVLWAVFATTFYCRPLDVVWNLERSGRLEEKPVCWKGGSTAEVLSVCHVVQGLILLCAPIVLLWKVRMGGWKKVRLFSTWAFGGITIIGGLLWMLIQSNSLDKTWGYTHIIVWALIDICFGMLTASLPVLDAVIVEAWHSTTKRLASGAHSRAELSEPGPAGDPGAREWTDKSRQAGSARVGISRALSSESQEHLAQQEVMDMELGILRTIDVEVRYSMVRTPSSINEAASDRSVSR